jgi:hypothetical protein
MAFKDQISKIKENWLLILLVVVVIGVVSYGGDTVSTFQAEMLGGYDKAMPMMAVERGGYYPSYDQDFAPEEEERVRIKRATLSTEVGKNTFKSAETKLKNIVNAAEAYILDENVNKYGDRFPYHVGYYRIKVETSKYDAVLSQIKEIGEVQSFNENIDDVTGTYVDLQEQLEAEKEKLKRYEKMYEEADDVEDKIMLSDRIFNQERTIKYLEKRIENIDKQVTYSTISFTIKEEQCGFAEIAFVKFSALVKALVNSINSLLSLIFVVLPWILIISIVWWIVKLVKKKK